MTDSDSTSKAAAGKIDRASRRRLQSFAFKVLLLIPTSVAFAAQGHMPIFGASAFFCGWYSMFAGLAAVVQRHKLTAKYLTSWDEMAAFLGLAAAVRLAGLIAG
jgi:hypothetical protein